jgi:hypothetical protein
VFGSRRSDLLEIFSSIRASSQQGNEGMLFGKLDMSNGLGLCRLFSTDEEAPSKGNDKKITFRKVEFRA